MGNGVVKKAILSDKSYLVVENFVAFSLEESEKHVQDWFFLFQFFGKQKQAFLFIKKMLPVA